MKTTMIKNLNAAAMVLVLLALSVSVLAQPPQNGAGYEKIQAAKVGFISKRLNLSVEEAQQFWPIYNEFEDQLNEIRKQERQTRQQLRDGFINLSEKEIEDLIQAQLNYKQQELDLYKAYNDKFMAVLPVRKIALLYKAQEDFKKYLLQQLGERRNNDKFGVGPGGPPGGR